MKKGSGQSGGYIIL